jgi:hypothetical protein
MGAFCIEVHKIMTTRMTDLTDAISDMGSAFEEFKTRSDKKLDDVVSRMEELEMKASRPGRGGPGEDAESREHKKRFEAWVRKPFDGATRQSLGDFQEKLHQIGEPGRKCRRRLRNAGTDCSRR